MIWKRGQSCALCTHFEWDQEPLLYESPTSELGLTVELG